ncbi:MAG: hypothetical protein ACYCW6_29565, partial [Candidatus Xenobia bacterium]
NSPEEILLASLVQDSVAQLARLQPTIPPQTAVAIGSDVREFTNLTGSHVPLALPITLNGVNLILTAQGEFVVKDPGPSTELTSPGNTLEGNVDVKPTVDKSALLVATGNNFTGVMRSGVVRRNLPDNIVDLVHMPNATDPEFFPVPFEPVPDITLPVATLRPFYKLNKTLVLNPQGTPPPNSFVVQGHSHYVIDTSCGNRFFAARPAGPGIAQAVTFSTGAGLELNNCTLLVNGNLDLSADAADIANKQPPLIGSNATLIVNGLLMLKDGRLDAKDQPMVIYCNQLIMQAKGTYKGLIISGGSASFFPTTEPPSDPSDVLTIQGGLICSGAPVTVAAGLPPLYGVTLWSTQVQYDAKFLKSLNQFGDFEVLSLQQIR